MNITKPTFSIIVPVYNVEQYLEQCIESILAQTYKDFELLLIDDGSKDSSGDICDKYSAKESRVKVIHKENGGVSKARNLALNEAKGDFVVFVDSDDWIESNSFEFVLNQIEGYDILFFDIVWHYDDGSTRRNSVGNFNVDTKEEVQQSIYRLIYNLTDVNLFGFTVNKVFRKGIIDKYKIRFVENLAISEDEIFTMEYCLRISSMKYVAQPLYHYIWKQQGLTHKYKEEKEYLLLIESMKQFFTDIKNSDLLLLQKSRIARYLNIAAWSNKNGLKILKGLFRLFVYCKRQNVSIPVVSVARELLNKLRRIQ